MVCSFNSRRGSDFLKVIVRRVVKIDSALKLCKVNG